MEIYCPHCGKMQDLNIGRLIGATVTPKKSAAAKLNGQLGGRPRKENPVRLRPYHAEHPEHHKWKKEQEMRYVLPGELK